MYKLLTISIHISTAIPHTVILWAHICYKLNARGLYTVCQKCAVMQPPVDYELRFNKCDAGIGILHTQ